MSVRNIRTVRQFKNEFPAFTEGGLRWLIFNAASNGLDDHDVLVRVGRRVYLDVDRFFEWIDSQQT